MRILKETGEYLYSSYLRESKRGRALLLVGIPVFFLGLCINVFATNPSQIGWLALLIGLTLSIWGAKYLASSRSYHKGIEGEKAVVEALRILDDSYSMINDVKLGKKSGNVDHVLICPKGVFAIETKNYSGDIQCYGDKWSKEVEGRLYDTKSVSNQVKNNAKHLSNLIREATNLGIFVKPICVFTDSGVRLQLHSPTVAVLRVAELAEFITEASPLTTLADSEIQMVVKCILDEHRKYSREGQNMKESQREA